MKKAFTETVFILDRSGSMRGLEEKMISSFNFLIRKQRQEAGRSLVYAVLFDDRIEMLYDGIPVDKVRPMSDTQYYVRGNTALLDAVGGAIRHIESRHRIKKGMKPEKTRFIIATDGQDNSSWSYGYHQVRRMIEKRKAKSGWEFLFIGADMDAVEVQKHMFFCPLP